MQETRMPIVDPTAIWVVFHAYVISGTRSKTSGKFNQRKGSGQNEGVTACWSVMSAVRMTKANGAMEMMATAVSSEWRATAIKNRRRRTSSGTGLRGMSAALA